MSMANDSGCIVAGVELSGEVRGELVAPLEPSPSPPLEGAMLRIEDSGRPLINDCDLANRQFLFRQGRIGTKKQ